MTAKDYQLENDAGKISFIPSRSALTADDRAECISKLITFIFASIMIVLTDNIEMFWLLSNWCSALPVSGIGSTEVNLFDTFDKCDETS